MLYQVSLLLLNVFHLLQGYVSLLTTLEQVLRHVLGLGAHPKDVSVVSGHVWLDVIEQESLDQMSSVDFNINFFKECRHFKVVLANLILNQLGCQGLLVVQFESVDGKLGETICFERVEAIGRFAYIVNYHQRISEVPVARDKLNEVLVGERKTKLTAHIEPNLVVR